MAEIGSKIRCENFINNVETPGMMTLEDFVDDPDFCACVGECYRYIKRSISNRVINYDSSDRSDILVFITLMSILLGDSRNIIKLWYSVKDLELTSVQNARYILESLGYEWMTESNGMTIDDERQILFGSLYLDIMKNKGTIEAIISVIKSFDMQLINGNYPKVSDIEVSDVDIANVWDTTGILFSTDYLELALDLNGNVIPDYQSVSNSYVHLLLEKIETVRPAGVMFTIPIEEFSLSGFDGGSYYRHSYPMSSQGSVVTVVVPWNDIAGGNILKSGGSYITVYYWDTGVERSVSESYDKLLGSMWLRLISIDISDIYEYSYSDVDSLDFDTGTLFNNTGFDDESNILYGLSGLYDNNGDIINLVDMSMDCLLKRQMYSYGLEIS